MHAEAQSSIASRVTVLAAVCVAAGLLGATFARWVPAASSAAASSCHHGIGHGECLQGNPLPVDVVYPAQPLDCEGRYETALWIKACTGARITDFEIEIYAVGDPMRLLRIDRPPQNRSRIQRIGGGGAYGLEWTYVSELLPEQVGKVRVKPIGEEGYLWLECVTGVSRCAGDETCEPIRSCVDPTATSSPSPDPTDTPPPDTPIPTEPPTEPPTVTPSPSEIPTEPPTVTPSPSVTALPTTQPPDEPCDEGAPFTLIIDERINCPLGLPCPPPVNDPYMFPDTAYVVHDTTPAYGDHGWSIKFSADYAYGTTIAHHECHIDPVTGQILACVVTNEQGGILYGHPSTAIQGQGQPASRECTEWLLTYVISGEFLARYSTWPNGQYGPICWELLPPPGRTDPAWRAEIDVPTSAQHMAGFRVANGHDWWPNGPDYFCGRCNGMFGRNFVCQECPQTPVRLCPSSNQMLTVVLDDMPKYQMLFFTQSIQ